VCREEVVYTYVHACLVCVGWRFCFFLECLVRLRGTKP
jgi:hypothetical protein